MVFLGFIMHGDYILDYRVAAGNDGLRLSNPGIL